MGRRMFRTHRLRLVGVRTSGEFLLVSALIQDMTGPAGWQDNGTPLTLHIPIERLLEDDVSEACDRAVRKQLKAIWSPSDGTEPLF